MKSIKLFTLILLLTFGIFILDSCQKKGCTNEKATNFDSKAKKDDGSCIIDRRDNLIGNYNCTDSLWNGGTLSVYPLIVQITKHATDTSKLIIDFKNSTYDMLLAGNSFSFHVIDGIKSYNVNGQFEASNKIYMQDAWDQFIDHIHGTK